jgi:acyl-coenzyme A synthetase/AMP-(fatty) acid ligase
MEMRTNPLEHTSSASRTMFRDALQAPANRASVIADAHQECGYPEMPACIDAIQEYLTQCGVQPGECLTLELTNAVPSALMVLACIDAGYSIMPMPIEGRGARAVGSQFPTARFSRWIVAPKDAVPPGPRDLRSPSTYVDVRPNPSYDASAHRPTDGARLYVRTSGSLGATKLVARFQSRVFENVRDSRERLRLGPAHRVALPIPIFHAFGLGPAFLASVVGGASIDLQDQANLLHYLERERRFNPNVAFVTPSFCEILVRGRRAPRRYEFMITGGDRIGQTTFFRSEELHGPLINAYGCTEMGFIFCGDVDMPAELRFRTVGRPLPGVRFRIVEHPDSSDREVGSLQIQYPNAFERYVDLDGLAMTVEKAFDQGWYCAADLVKQGPDGTLEVLGRSDLSVNRNGLLLAFADLESALREVEDIEEAGVAAGPDSIRGRKIVAFCALRRGSERSEAELRADLSGRVPLFAVPDRIRVVSRLPRLPNGKLDRRQLAAWAQVDSHSGAPRASPHHG